jgi:hypothetical protein
MHEGGKERVCCAFCVVDLACSFSFSFSFCWFCSSVFIFIPFMTRNFNDPEMCSIPHNPYVCGHYHLSDLRLIPVITKKPGMLFINL